MLGGLWEDDQGDKMFPMLSPFLYQIRRENFFFDRKNAVDLLLNIA